MSEINTSDYDTHRVSCKIAIFNEDKTKVLLAKYHNGTYGLLGGHIDDDELPDETLLRELHEELGIDYDGPMIHYDFFAM